MNGELKSYGLTIPQHKCPDIELKQFAARDATCDKELPGLLHIPDLMRPVHAAGARVRSFTGDRGKIINQK